MANLHTLAAVVTALTNVGLPASLEYPGFVRVTKNDIDYHFGVANGPWGGDVVTDQGELAMLCLPRVIPSTETDAVLIASTIEDAILADQQELGYASR